MVHYPTIISPCISICRLDNHNVCVGCYRTQVEICDWYTLDNEAKANILQEVEKRKPKK